MMETHAQNLERVSLRIAAAVHRFFRLVLDRSSHRFHADDLRRYVIAQTGIAAPASADRVLRHLRQTRQLDYRLVSRRESLYEALPRETPPPQPPQGPPPPAAPQPPQGPPEQLNLNILGDLP
jgi:hypothetical protein